MNKKEVIVFRKRIAPGEVKTFEERIKGAGTIEGLRIKFYYGQQLAFKVRPYIEHKGRKVEEMLTYSSGTDGYLSGDDDYFVYDVVIPVDNDDVLKVWVENQSAYEYNLSVDVVIDYYGGQNRVVGSVS